MIEFRGEMSEDCRHYILNKEKKIGVIATGIVATLFCIPTIILAIMWDWIFSIFILVLVFAVVLAWVAPNKKTYPLIIPYKLMIDNGVIKVDGEKFHYSRTVNQVKKLIDMGGWYHIYFYYRYRSLRFVCQKDLIKENTLEEFEDLFKEKLVRKVK